MIQVTTLDNGLRVITDRMDHVQTASLGVWVGVGARHEDEAENGVAHLLEHMAFKGTERRSARRIAEEIEAVGGVLNAYTGRETTAYLVKVLKEDVPLAVDLLGDILLNSTFAEEELARERQVIIQEIGQAIDTPDDIIFDRFQETAFPGQALGRSILGHADVVRSISREAVASYMKRHYGGERMVLAAAGAVDHDRLVALAQAAFQDLPRGSAATAQPARYDGGDYREARGIEQTHLLIGLPGGSLLDDQFYAEQVLATLLGGGMSSRLFQEVRERRGLAYTVGTVPMSYSDGGVFGIYAACAPRDGRELGDVVCDEILRVAEDITAEEVTRAKTQLKAHLMMAMESTGMRAEAVANHLLLFDKPLSPEDIIAQVDAVSLDDVTAQATGLRRGRPTVTAIGPIQDLAPYDEIARRLPEAA